MIIVATAEKKLSELALARGAARVGFADLTHLPPEPRRSMPTGVSLAAVLDARVAAGLYKGPSEEYVLEYERLNDQLAHLSGVVADALRTWGFDAITLPPTGMDFDPQTLSTALPHKTVATRAGMGWIGKNALLITEQYGAAVRLGTVLTDADLDSGTPVDHSRCGDCMRCVQVCPAEAPTGRNWNVALSRQDLLDAHACSAFAECLSEKLGSAHTVCGMCIAACPWTQKYVKAEG